MQGHMERTESIGREAMAVVLRTLCLFPCTINAHCNSADGKFDSLLFSMIESIIF